MDSTQHILTIFETLSAIPRGSGREEQISLWLQGLAREAGMQSAVDPSGNLVIRVPGTPGREAAPMVVLQGHMDMVCEKTPDSTHNFLVDPIRCIVDGDWLHADHTTLGADNGISIALALALVADPSVAHPPLELLFTVQEEVGLGGAHHLQPGFLNGKILVNLDSEDEGTFVIGCAGGQTTHIHMALTFEEPTQKAAFMLKVSGLRGGHSGVDIHKHYASANKLVARALEHAKVQKFGQSGFMRAADHQFQQPLVVGLMDHQGEPGVAFDVEGSSYGFRVVKALTPQAAAQPTSCVMQRY